MIKNLFYLFILLFLVIYFLRALLMVGFNHLKHKNNMNKGISMTKELALNMLLLKPLLQMNLGQRNTDYKIYLRFKRKSIIYYYVLWVTLFIILLLGGKLYLHWFE